MVTIAEWYKRVNQQWPREIPPMTFEAGCNAVRRLFRYAEGQAWTGEIIEVSGNRYNWTQHGTFRLNTGGNGHGHDRRPHGWKDLIHDLSHLFVRRSHQGIKPHSREHAKLELRLVKEVVKRGWLTPQAIEPAPKLVDDKAALIALKLERTNAALKRWNTKAKRAQTAIKKLKRRQAYYERRSAGKAD